MHVVFASSLSSLVSLLSLFLALLPGSPSLKLGLTPQSPAFKPSGQCSSLHCTSSGPDKWSIRPGKEGWGVYVEGEAWDESGEEGIVVMVFTGWVRG